MKACTNAYFSLAHLEVNNQKLEPFVMASEVLEAPRSRKEKMTILGTRNKVRSKFFMRKTNGFCLFNKFVQNFIFFTQLKIKKVGFITLILGKF